MATATLKVLGQVNPSATTDTTLYTVPSSTQAVCSSLTVCNQGTSTALIRVAVRPAGATIAAKHYLLYDHPLAAKDTLTFEGGVSLATTDVVTVRSDSASVSFNLFGQEIA